MTSGDSPGDSAASTNLAGIIKRDIGTRRITADYVAEALREAIASGELPDGSVLNQAALAAHFGVSRVPVREAMRELQAEGLIETRAHRVAVVRGLDLDRFVEVYSLRGLLEGWLVEQALPHLTEEDVASARELNAAMAGTADHAEWLQLNSRFHRTLYEPSGCQVTMELLDQLRARAERYVRLWSGGAGVHRHAETHAEHEEIIGLVAAGDAAGARAAVERHALNTRDSVIAHRRAAEAEAQASADSEPERAA